MCIDEDVIEIDQIHFCVVMISIPIQNFSTFVIMTMIAKIITVRITIIILILAITIMNMK